MGVSFAPDAPEPFKRPVQYMPVRVPTEQPKNILFVVHRYAPYQGGSENYVRDMAEEMYCRGHNVSVFAGEHKGDLNGVHVTHDVNILFDPWDLIVVHGGDVPVQNFVLSHIEKLGGPVLYLLILPSHSPVCVRALHTAQFIGCSTFADWRHVRSYNAQARAVRVRHGIVPTSTIGESGFRRLYNITTPYMFLSGGGFWPNKAFDELEGIFNEVGRTDTTLVLTGYDNRHGLMRPDTEYVKHFLLEERDLMLAALRESNLYILNSYSEGFGLVLLESMLNLIPWAARNIAGAETMREYGFTYDTPQQLREYLANFMAVETRTLLEAQKYAAATHLIRHTADDILRCIK